MTYRVMVTRYGFIDIDADSESEACQIADDADDSDFQWGSWGDPEVVEILEDEE